MSKNVYILLTQTGTVVSKIIRKRTNFPYNHVSIALDNELHYLYSFGRKVPRFPLLAGFVREDVKNGFYSIFKDTRCCVYKISVSEEEYSQLKYAVASFEQNCDRYKYNMIGLAGAWFNIPLGRKDHYFCTQFVANVLEVSGIFSFGKDPVMVRPEDFENVPNSEIVYKGLLCEYEPA
ncbi:MAG: hypothetical protein K0R90_288 [Oscillospiraceae bacterium]|jgi:hypothetical protein|nr:hypothetical protein [Oscillospiraceae bacterium]